MASQLISIDVGVESISPTFFPDTSKLTSETLGVERVPQFFLDSSQFYSIVMGVDIAPTKTIIIIT